MPSQSSSNQPSSGSNNSSGSGKAPTHYGVVKEGWGDRSTFQASHGLKMDPSGIEEGNLILDGYIQAGKDAWSSGKK
ncbi:unnamed protein product [Clonostachys rhizophaga]|uniref:Uncharacterized protein n=1 Tax=Clonostachys rhizophaga TaxID=160324 RepID=A0A9N9W1N8_9HYPO|nr:unnamed protein product [Clonostachys rhizophaga]